MAHFLPVGQLVVYLAKSAVKPVSRKIINFAKNRPAFINSCVWMADKNHQMYINISRISGNRLPYTEKLAEKHKQMSKEEAVEFFTDLMGELLMIGAGVFFIVWEYRRGKKHRKTSNENDRIHAQRLDKIEKDMQDIITKLDLLLPNDTSISVRQ